VVRFLVATCLALSGLDAAVTLRGVRGGQAPELNPLLGALLAASPFAFVVAKAALSAGAVLLLARHPDPRVARLTLSAAALGYLAVSLGWGWLLMTPG
jgi:Domain of unknown function (DUF5658)